MAMLCADGSCQRTVSWKDDLPRELREIILPHLPLLSLAKLAHLSKEFQEAYRQRRAANFALAAPLHDVCVGPAPYSFTRALEDELRIRKYPLSRCYPLSPHDPFAGYFYNDVDTTEMQICSITQNRRTRTTLVFGSLQAPFLVFGSFDVKARGLTTATSLSLHARMEIEVVVGLTGRFPVCKELVLECSGESSCLEQDLKGWLMFYICMAPNLRRYLIDVARGPPRDYKRVGKPGLIQAVTLVLPRDSDWPKEREEALIWEALTCFLGLVGGKPSGTRIALERDFTNEKSEPSKGLLRAVHGR
jgi:hypothetical protein